MRSISSFLRSVGFRDRRALPAAAVLAIASGLSCVLAAPRYNLWPLGYLVVVPLLWLAERPPTRRRAFLYGWFAGFVANATGFYWLTSLFTRYAALHFSLAMLALVLLSAYQGLVFALFAVIVRRIRGVSRAKLAAPLPMVLVAPLVMVSCELVVPFIFPWYLAITQAHVTPAIQIAELTGPLGVTALICAVGGAIYDLAANCRAGAGAAGAVVLAAVLVFGFVRMHQIDDRRRNAPTLTIGLVQGNFPLEDPNRTYRSDLRMLDQLQRESAELQRRGAELIVWSEAIYPFPIERLAPQCDGSGCTYGRDFATRADGRIRHGFSVPLVFGALTGWEAEPKRDPYNSAFMMDRRGVFTGRYDKNFLLVGSEYIPGIKTFPWLLDILPQGAGNLSRGRGVVIFGLRHGNATYRLAPIICYEDIVPAFTRKVARLHPHLLVNMTNDTWFGDTNEPWQHLAASVFRAVELRTDMVRAVNSGVSAFIDANGRVVAHSYVVDPALEHHSVDGLLGKVALLEGGHTVYAAVGDLFGYLCLLATLLLWLVWSRTDRFSSRRSRP